MRKIYLFLSLICLSLLSFGQVVVNEGFEEAGVYPPPGWSITGGSGSTFLTSGTAGSPTTTGPHGGTYYSEFNSYSLGTGTTAYISTKVIDYTNRFGTATTVSIWFWRDGVYYQGLALEGISAYINTVQSSLTGATLMGFVPRASNVAISGAVTGTSTPGTGTSGWYQYSFTVPPTYNGATNYIIFSYYSQFGDNCFLDDISYTAYPGPTTTLSTTTMAFGLASVGTSTAASSFTVAGAYYTSSPVTVTAPIGYQVSLTGLAGSFTTSLTIPVTIPTLPTTPVYVQFSPTSNIAYGGNITISGGGAATSTVAVSGTGTYPIITNSTPSLNFGTVVVGATPPVLSYNISGTFMAPSLGNVLLTAPSDFKLSATGLVGSWASTLTIPVASQTLASTPVFVQFAPSAYSVYSASVVPTGSGISVSSSNPIPVTGQGVFPCNGTPTAGTASIAPTSGGAATVFNLNDVGSSIGGTTYQWQSWSFGAAGYVNFGPSSSSPALSFTGITNNTYFRCVVTCTYTGQSSITAPVLVTLTPAPTPCSGTPAAGTVTATSTVGCAPSYTSNLYNVSPAVGPDIAYNWQISTTSATAGFTNIAGATTPYFTQSVSGSTVWIRDSITCLTAVTSAKTTAVQLVLNPAPSAITGFANICNPSPVAYTATPAGGTWTSSNTTYLGINPSTGFATPTGAAGAATVSYTISSGCSTSLNVNVYNGPLAIAGATSVCPGTSTTLTNPMWGGVWSSTNSSVATIGTNGVVTGVASGSFNVSYTLPAGCSTYMPMAVYPNPAPITGTNNVCAGGATTVLSSLTSGGTWSCNNTVLATVGGVSGIVTGLSAGNPVINYTLATGCTVSMPITVNPLPSAIAGTPSVCIGSSSTLTDIGGGTWSSSDNYTATVNSATGLVNGLAAGNANISYTLPSTGCFITMPFTVNPLPIVNTVTGGGGYCPASTGVHIGLNSSQNAVNYSLYYIPTSSVAATMPGSTSSIDFGMFTGVGSYSVVATNTATGCRNAMAGTANVSVNPLPRTYLVSGGGAYCNGGIGLHVVTNGSEVGTSYQLYVDAVATGLPVIGDGNSIDFGLQTASGHYTVIATNQSTLCSKNMTGGADIIINPTPTANNVMGGGNYCVGGAGRDIYLDNSQAGFEYKLYNGTLLLGTLTGTTSAIDFGNQTISGNYYVTGKNPLTGCMSNMSGSANINIDPLPTGYNLNGGGNYCAGGTGTHIGMDHTVVGTNYQLMTSGSALTTVAGTNAGIDFGLFTTTGSYSVMATIAATGCHVYMPNNVTVGINNLPIIQNIRGGGSYCNGGTGVEVYLDGSETGKTYQLYLAGSAVGSIIPGNGGRISFGLQTTPGVYTAQAYNPATTCMRYMAGSVTVTRNDNPTIYNVTGGGSYCAGTGGAAIMLSGSQSGINYQTVNSAGIITGMVAGTATSGSFNIGNQTAASVYSVKAVNLATGCSSMMNGSVPVAILPLPAQYTVTGGGTICAGDAGLSVGLLTSNTGYSYQLQLDGHSTGAALLGTGGTMDFGTQTANGTYSIIGTNSTTGCSNSMANTVALTVNPLPSMFTVLGGGSFCAGEPGADVRLSGSNLTGVSYQLWNGSMLVATMPATGAAIDFGYQTVTGNYTVKATSSHGCVNMMAASAAVTANPLPVVYTVTGGGSYCEGGTGVHIGLTGSQIFVNYQVSGGSGTTGSFWAGTGSALDLGAYTGAGTFYVRATDTLTHCSSNMTGSTTITVNPSVIPSVAITTGTGAVCEGSVATYTATSVNGGLSPHYEWFVGGMSVGYGATYSYVPNNMDIVKVVLTSDALCASPAVVTRNITATVNPNETPTIMVSANTGATVCPGTPVTYSAATTFGGSTPGYAWKKDGTTVSTSPTYTYVPEQGDAISCALTSNFACRTETFVLSNSVVMTIDAPVAPAFNISGANGTIVVGHSATLSANLTNSAPNATYQWSVNGMNVVGEINPTFTSDKFVNGDNVCCSIVSHNSCGTSEVVTNCVTVRVANVGVTQVASINDLSIVPNPNKGIFSIKGSIASSVDANVTLEITNMLGQVVYSNKINAANGVINEQIQLSNSVAPGMYLLNVRSGAETSVFHFVVE